MSHLGPVAVASVATTSMEGMTARVRPLAGPQAPAPETAAPARSYAMVALVLGCLFVGSSSALIKLSGASAGTAAFLRCAIAMVVFAPVLAIEWRRFGRPPGRMLTLSAGGGVLLGADYLMWTQSIVDIGAGIATVLIGVQVVVFPLLAWVFQDERVTRRFLILLPLMFVGLALTGGVIDADAAAPHPVRGALLGVAAGVCYAAFLFLTRPASALDRRMIFTPVGTTTLVAALGIGVVAGLGGAAGGIDLALSAKAWALLATVAVLGQAVSFVLIGYGLVRIPAGRAAAVMLLQPLGAVALGVVLVHERPTVTQWAGIVLTVVAVGLVTVTRRRRPDRRPA